MTDLAELTHEIDQLMCTLKQKWVADKPDSTDLSIHLHVYRDEGLVAAVQCPLDRDASLQAAHLMVIGMNATTIVHTFESWHSKEKKSPATGEAWEPGEMAFLGQTSPEAIEKGWVRECLTTLGHSRDGHSTLLSHPYLIEGTEVTFGDYEFYDSAEEGTQAGLMHDAYATMFAAPTILEQMENSTEPKMVPMQLLSQSIDDDEVRMFHLDCATMRSAMERGVVISGMLAAEEGSSRQQMIEERFGPMVEGMEV